MKYGRDMYEVIESKLLIFYDCCHHLSILLEQYSNAVPIMLKGYTLMFYYNWLCDIPKPQNFQDMISWIKVHFENEECSQIYLLNWQNTTLMKIITKNSGKPKTECLELLFDKLMSI